MVSLGGARFVKFSVVDIYITAKPILFNGHDES